MITAENINKHFMLNNEKVQVLKDVTLEIKQGDFLSIVGRSGSGKTTLLNVLSTLVHADDGLLRYNDINLSDSTPVMLNQLRQKDER